MSSITARSLRYDSGLLPSYFKLKEVENDGEEPTLQDIFNANLLCKPDACSAFCYRLVNDNDSVEDVLFFPYAGFYVSGKMFPMSVDVPVCIKDEIKSLKQKKNAKEEVGRIGNDGWIIQVVDNPESRSAEIKQEGVRLSEMYRDYEVECKRWDFPPLLLLQKVVSIFPIFSVELRYQSIDTMIARWRFQTTMLLAMLVIVAIASVPLLYAIFVLIAFTLIAGIVCYFFYRSKKYAIRACTGQEREQVTTRP